MDTEGEGEVLNPNEIELIFKPHPTEMMGDNQLMRALRDSSVRFLKTTANASGISFLIQKLLVGCLSLLKSIIYYNLYYFPR